MCVWLYTYMYNNMDELKFLSERAPELTFMWSSRKATIIHSDRRHSGYLWGGWEECGHSWEGAWWNNLCDGNVLYFHGMHRCIHKQPSSCTLKFVQFKNYTIQLSKIQKSMVWYQYQWKLYVYFQCSNYISSNSDKCFCARWRCFCATTFTL